MRSLYHLLHRRGIADIGDGRLHFASGAGNSSAEFFESRAININGHYADALTRHHQRGGASDSVCRTRDNRGAAFEIPHEGVCNTGME